MDENAHRRHDKKNGHGKIQRNAKKRKKCNFFLSIYTAHHIERKIRLVNLFI